MREIPLTQGKIALVDDSDFTRLNQWKWCLHNAGYAVRNSCLPAKESTILMHRIILDAPHGIEVDHINMNRLDNRRCNLRLCSKAQQQGNRRKTRERYSSRFRGVSWSSDRNKWRAQIGIAGRAMHLGYFDDEREAGVAYNIAAQEFFGVFARLNEIEETVS